MCFGPDTLLRLLENLRLQTLLLEQLCFLTREMFNHFLIVEGKVLAEIQNLLKLE